MSSLAEPSSPPGAYFKTFEADSEVLDCIMTEKTFI